MARFIPKQFAENSTTSVVFGSYQEQGGHVGDGTISSDPATLQGGTAWPLGWSAATDNFFQIPRGEEMEGLERVLSAAIIQQFTDGLTFWQSEMPVTQYQTIVQYQTGSDLPKLYINITGTSTSTPPDSDTTNWYMFLDTGASLANVDLSNLTATGEAHFANPALSNLTNGLANTICTTPATTTSTASSATPAVVVENYKNGDAWYRVWSDGWIEQGGYASATTAAANQTVNLNKAFTTTNYFAVVALATASTYDLGSYQTDVFSKTTTSFKTVHSANKYWYACGY